MANYQNIVGYPSGKTGAGQSPDEGLFASDMYF